jgi:hypothetical protein
MDIPTIFDKLPARYKPGKVSGKSVYYFSIGDHKYTVVLEPDGCSVEEGKTIENADVILKTTPKLFEKMVIDGKMPGPLDIARGKVKTNDPKGLMRLREYFDFDGV